MSTRDPIPVTAVFDEPAGAEGTTLIVGTEHGDIIVHAEFVDHPDCTFVLTMDNALALSMWLVAHVVDERRRRQASEPAR
jgi:hypothetical protein